MTVLTTFSNGGDLLDFRDTFNAMLADIAILKGAGSAAATPTPTPTITAMPSGVVAMWDAASLSSLADGAPVTTWTDATGGSVASQTNDSGTSHTYVADSGGGLPAVRLSGAAVLATRGTNAANTATTGNDFGIIVVARNFKGTGAGQANPVIVASGDGTNLLLQATPSQTGRYGSMYDCGDPGTRSFGKSQSTALGITLDNVNGTAIATTGQPGGQITIGGWKNAGTQCCGVADVLAVIVFSRTLTAADFKQVYRRYCELIGQVRPGDASARNVTFLGDSLTAGYQPGFLKLTNLRTATPIDWRVACRCRGALGIRWEWQGTRSLM